MRKMLWAALVLCTILATPGFAQRSFPGRGGARPGRAPSSDDTREGDEPTSPGAAQEGNRHGVIMNLSKGVDVGLIVKFISDKTGKPVLKDSDVSGKITVYSAEKIPEDKALKLIYDALELAGIAVIETPDHITMVKAEKAKTMKMPILQSDESASSITNKTQIIQKVFKLRTTSPKEIKDALKELVGKQGSIGVDEDSKTIIVTDTASNIERFEQLVAAFDRVDEGQIISRLFKLEYADAEDLAEIVSTMAVAGEGGEMEVRSRRDHYSSYDRYRRGRAQGRVAGDVVVIPDPRTNWLVAVGPPDKMLRIEKLVEQLDQPGRSDAQLYIIDIKHADAYDIADDLENLLARKLAREKQEILDVDSSSRGNQLMVLATPKTYKIVQELVKELDTADAVQRETRTYELTYMDAEDMAQQLNDLYQEDLRSIYSPWSSFGRSSSSRNQPRFVPSVRTNSLMVIAQPSEYEFIEKMIHELDVEIPEENLAPRVYHIVHTDASEMATVLEELFEGDAARRPGSSRGSFNPFGWRPRGSDTRQEGIGALYGKVRFVVYRNTNSIVAITSNPQNFPVIEGLIKDLDLLDPEATNMLVIQLQYADAAELANNLNNLLSEGPVAQRGQQQGQQQQRGGGADGNEEEPAPVPVFFPWQASQRRSTREGEEERPISSLIGHVRLVPDVRSQKLIVAAPAIYFDAIRLLVEDLDKPEPQVQLQTYLVRIAKRDERRLGLRWTPDPTTIAPEELDNAIGALVDMGFIDTFAGRGGPRAPTDTEYQTDSTLNPWGQSGAFAFDQVIQPGKGVISAEVNLTVLLQLLIKNANASVMAHPQVTVNNNERGDIFLGESVPFPTGSVESAEGISSRTTFEYRDVGTRLLITPQINKHGRVVLRITITNERRKSEIVLGAPVTDRQTYETKLTVEDGQTIWLGGLTERRTEDIVRKFPLLGDIPVIGKYFSKTDKDLVVANVYTFVKPTVLETAAQADEQYRKARQEIEEFMKDYKQLDLDIPPADERTSAPAASLIDTGAETVHQIGATDTR